MNVVDLSISNFLTVKNARLGLADRGLVLIQGANEDDPSADSNGSGKSSLVDALSWVLYGATARGITGDAVVNKTAKKNCHVSVTLEDGGERWAVMRYRKDKDFKNALMVFKVADGKGGTDLDLTKGTERETQAMLEKIIGCSLEVFMASVYAGQEAMPDLPAMTDKMLKALIEEAAGVEELSAAYNLARAQSNEVAGEVSRHKLTVTRVDASVASLESDVKSMTTDRAAWAEHSVAAAKAMLSTGTADLKERIGAAEAARAKLTPAEKITAELETIGKTLADHSKIEEEARVLDRRAASFSSAAAIAKRDLVRALTEVKRLDEELLGVASRLGKPCGECGHPYTEEDLAPAKKIALRAYDDGRVAAINLKSAYKTATDDEQAAREAAEKFRAALPDVSTLAARQSVLRDELSGHDKLDREIGQISADAAELKRDVEKTKTTPYPNEAALKIREADLAKAKSELLAASAALTSAETEAAHLERLVNIFGPAGVRAHILDTVTPFLNAKTAEYLGALADGNIHATWSTLSKTAKGELREKFRIEVVNDKGAESFAGLSGGEKRKVRLACAMALQDLVASRATKPIGIFIADEVDHALDESGLERLMGVLERKARDRGTVLVISHNSLSDWIDEVITVKKKDGVATVSGAVGAVK